MLALFARRLIRLLPVAAAPQTAYDQQDLAERGWHESSWIMAHGVEVSELPLHEAAALFPDTQPACHDAWEAPLAA